MPARVVSEGTLRLLGLLALGGAKEPPALLGFEEPENGIHPGRIELVAEYLKTQAAAGESQLIVTTHSPLLLDMLDDDSLFVCRKRDGQTCRPRQTAPAQPRPAHNHGGNGVSFRSGSQLQ
jgi:predicted ATPase